MFKVIRNILICLILGLGVFFGLQWKNYQAKAQYRQDALLYFHEEDYQKAISYLEEGLDKMSFFGQDMDQDMSCYLGESYYQLGEYDQAVEIYDQLIADDSKTKMFYFLKAEACEAQGEHEKAVEVLQMGWEKTEDSVFLTRICDSYIAAEDYEKALSYAQKGAEAEDENSADFLYKEIVIYEKCQDYQSAYAVATKYVSLYPDDEKGVKELTFLSTRI